MPATSCGTRPIGAPQAISRYVNERSLRCPDERDGAHPSVLMKMKHGIPSVSIVLTDMDRTAFALHGFRSWLLQDFDEPYEVIICLFNEEKRQFERLCQTGNPNATIKIYSWERPEHFNISAANNLGLHYAQGHWVFFANSDVIYPSGYLKPVVDELRARDLWFALGSRVNLSYTLTEGLNSPFTYNAIGAYDFLQTAESSSESGFWGFGSPWIIERTTAVAIGGYDPRILCHEDRDITERAMCFLRRHMRQTLCYAIIEHFGYHLFHPQSDLYAFGESSRSILRHRKELMSTPEGWAACVVNNDLNDLACLVSAMKRTPKPEVHTGPKPSFATKVMGRCKKAFQTLLYG